VEKVKDDGDWHIELTQRADSPADSCVVVEIPAPKYSARTGRSSTPRLPIFRSPITESSAARASA